jgi:DNA primase
MGIPAEDVALVRQSTDVIALIGEYTPLKRVGRRYVGLCPFHSEKSGSFSVNAEEGLYYCFGCAASGDVISFLRAIEGCDFVEAVERLAARAGIAVRHDESTRHQADRDQQQALKDAVARAVAFYHDRLLQHEDAAPARQYLRSRGYDGAVVREFRLGWAPESGTQLVRALKLPAKSLVESGLAHQGNYGLSDTFRGRVIFPIFDPSGNAIALGGRVLPGTSAQGPKYRNSQESPIYSKRRTLYGLNWARQGIVQAGEVVVCEGYTDVIGFFTAGVPRAVATCGTALTEDHFTVLARFAKRVVLAFDADAAGQSAAARFYEWERRHDVEVAVAALPPGGDPGELAQTDPEQLAKAVSEAKNFLGFRVDRALAVGDLRSAEGRAKAAEEAIKMIAEHPNELVRDQYLVTVADRTHLEVDQLRRLLEQARRHPAPAAKGVKERGTSGPGAGRQPSSAGAGRGREPGAVGPGSGPDEDEPLPFDPDGPSPDRVSHNGRAGGGAPARTTAGQLAGRHALTIAIHDPAAMANRLDEVLFADPVQREAFAVLAGATSLHEAIDRASEPAAELLRQLAVSEPEAHPDQTLVALARVSARQALTELQADARTAEADADTARLSEVGAAIAWLQAELEVIQDAGVNDRPPVAVIEAADSLVAWLVRRQGESE